jgi:hypothetical protein
MELLQYLRRHSSYVGLAAMDLGLQLFSLLLEEFEVDLLPLARHLGRLAVLFYDFGLFMRI